jgi:dihydroorotate dehydrogenase
VVAIGAGGLSGPPLNARSLDVLRLLRGRVGEEMTLISVGGITTVADARARLDAGATLLQGYTAFIYEGPRWPTRIVAGLHNSQGVDR